MSKKKFALKLVERQGEKIFTTSLVIAEGADVSHQSTLRLIRKHSDRLNRHRQVGFEVRLNRQGSRTEIAILDERQATLLLTFLKNTEVVLNFKERLVDEFYRMRDELTRIHRQQANPEWQAVRRAVKDAFKLVNLVLQETRKLLGKETESHHYTNEARLMNGVLTGEYKALVRDELTDEQLCLLDSIEQENSRLMIQGRTYQERKQSLLDKFIPKLPETLH